MTDFLLRNTVELSGHILKKTLIFEAKSLFKVDVRFKRNIFGGNKYLPVHILVYISCHNHRFSER